MKGRRGRIPCRLETDANRLKERRRGLEIGIANLSGEEMTGIEETRIYLTTKKREIVTRARDEADAVLRDDHTHARGRHLLAETVTERTEAGENEALLHTAAALSLRSGGG